MPEPGAGPPRLAVVVPAHRAAAEIETCLDALFAAGFTPGEVLVVDDGSPDDTGGRARARGVRVLRNAEAQRPARARNRGAAAAEGDVVVFVDADVAVHPDVRARILAHFGGDPELDAVFGSYDDAPPAPSVVSRYRNLLHHFVHQSSRTEAVTFWTGLGAVRREAFLRLGGLDRRWEDIEDVEFGLRLSRAGGRIRLDPELQGTHLKAWTLRSMFLTDLHGRAKPWARLLVRRAAETGDLNTAPEHRVSAAAVLAGAAALAVAPVEPRALWVVGAAGLAFLAANRRFLGFLARKRGPGFAAAALPFHVAHYAAAVLGYLTVRFGEAASRR